MQHHTIRFVRRVAKTFAVILTLFMVFCGAIVFVDRWNNKDGGEISNHLGPNPGLGGITPNADGLPGSSTSGLSLSKLFSDSGKATNLQYDSDISMQAQDPSDTLDKAVHVVTNNGGAVVSMSVESGDSESATGQFKVPSANFLSVIDQVSVLGMHARKSVNASDPSQYSYGYGGTTTQNQVNNATFYVEIAAPTSGLRDRSLFGAFGHAAAEGWSATGFAARIVLASIGTLLPLSLVIVPAFVILAIGVRLTRRAWRKVLAFLHI